MRAVIDSESVIITAYQRRWEYFACGDDGDFADGELVRNEIAFDWVGEIIWVRIVGVPVKKVP